MPSRTNRTEPSPIRTLTPPECRLRGVEFHAALRQGPAGPAGVFKRRTSYKPMPVIQYWLPTLAARFGYGPNGVPGRIAGWMCECGVKLASGPKPPVQVTCRTCGA